MNCKYCNRNLVCEAPFNQNLLCGKCNCHFIFDDGNHTYTWFNFSTRLIFATVCFNFLSNKTLIIAHKNYQRDEPCGIIDHFIKEFDGIINISPADVESKIITYMLFS